MAVLGLLVSCTGGDGTGGEARRPASSTTSGPPSTPATTTPTTTAPADPQAGPPGSVTLRAAGFTLPAGAGVRVVVSASSPRLTVRRRGPGGALSACPVPDATTAANPAACVDLVAGSDVDLSPARGAEIRAAGAGARVEEVSLTYLAQDRSTTLVTPARPAGSCAATACLATFSLSPPRAGSFALVGRASGGRPRLTLRAERPPNGGSRVLATAEGGGALSITATLEPSVEAVLEYHEQVDGAVGAVVMEILWP